MTRIRVNPDGLDNNAGKILSVSNLVSETGKRARNAANTAPSYNGQFGPKVKAIGVAAFSQAGSHQANLAAKTENLQQIANRFRMADSQVFGTSRYILRYVPGLGQLIKPRPSIYVGPPSNGWKTPPNTVARLAEMIEHYTSEENPIAIIKMDDNEYLVLIRGTVGGNVENNWGNNLDAYPGDMTYYELSVLEMIHSRIPRGANIHIAGHSQGGIIANNVVNDLTEGYTVRTVTTFGTPAPPYKLPKDVITIYYRAEMDAVPLVESIYQATRLRPDLKIAGNILVNHIDEVVYLIKNSKNIAAFAIISAIPSLSLLSPDILFAMSALIQILSPLLAEIYFRESRNKFNYRWITGNNSGDAKDAHLLPSYYEDEDLRTRISCFYLPDDAVAEALENRSPSIGTAEKTAKAEEQLGL